MQGYWVWVEAKYSEVVRADKNAKVHPFIGNKKEQEQYIKKKF